VSIRLNPSGDGPFDIRRIEDIDIVIDNGYMLDIRNREQRHDGVLAVTGLLLDRCDDMPVAAAARSYVDRRRLDARLVQNPPRRRFVDRRTHPDIFPWHMKRIVNRVFAMHDRFDPHVGVHMNPAHQSIELAERTFRMDPAFRQNLPFQNDFCVGDAGDRYRFAVGQTRRLSTQPTGKSYSVDSQVSFEGRGNQLVGMGTDRDRNRNGFFCCNARSANFRKLLGVTMSMPVIFLSLSIKRYMPAFMPNSGSSAMTTPAVIIGPPSITENTGTGNS